MHPADIKAELEKRGLSQVAIAKLSTRGEGRHVDRSAVCRVINGTLTSRQIARCISQAICQPVGVLWPGKYPDLEFIEAAGLEQVTAAQAEADLSKLQRPAAKAPAKKPARKSPGGRP